MTGKERIKVGCLVAWAIIFVILFIISIIFYFEKQWDFSNVVTFVNVAICDSQNNKDDFRPGREMIIPEGSGPFYVCGELKTTIPIELSLFLYTTNENKYIFHTEIYELRQGFVKLLIDSVPNLAAGKYRVEVWYARKLLSTTFFSISSLDKR